VLFDTQQDVIACLMDPATHGGSAVSRVETHSAIVFLAGARALKLKRAVRFDYLDFSTESRRKAACEAEVRINRLAAPSIYRGVIPVTRDASGSLALGGRGAPVDWLVDMVRFDEEGLFDRLAARRALDLDFMPSLAAAIARFHEAADRRDDHGGRAGMQWVVDGNAEGFADQGAGVLDPALCSELTRKARAEIDRVADLLDRRVLEGRVRQCHGDLHLRNIVLLEGRPTLFDAVEFNDEIACVDVWYDVAFLLMDLWRRRLELHANAVFNSYIVESGDRSGLTLLPLFLSCRAAIRAKTSATSARMQRDGARAGELGDLAREYLVMARDFLEPGPPRLIAVGGFSGSGKSTLARAIAPSIRPAPGAVVVRSDEVRKSLLGVPIHERLGPEGYTADVTERVYGAVSGQALEALEAGHSAVADAVFARSSDRIAIEQLATKVAVPFLGLWLDAPPDVLSARTETRGPDASDAGPSIVQRQVAQGHGQVSWHVLDASASAEVVAERARALVNSQLPTTKDQEHRTKDQEPG
jgi:aminoglycoside phosphotransferase family enzyme/predicted kinase